MRRLPPGLYSCVWERAIAMAICVKNVSGNWLKTKRPGLRVFCATCWRIRCRDYRGSRERHWRTQPCHAAGVRVGEFCVSGDTWTSNDQLLELLPPECLSGAQFVSRSQGASGDECSRGMTALCRFQPVVAAAGFSAWRPAMLPNGRS
jgi:hypothetical protein